MFSMWPCTNCDKTITEYDDCYDCEKCGKSFCHDCRHQVTYYICCGCEQRVEINYEQEHLNCSHEVCGYDNNENEDEEDCVLKRMKIMDKSLLDTLVKERVSNTKCNYCNYTKKWVANT